MELLIAKSNLVQGIQIVSKAVPSKTTMSILECILIDASGADIRLIANDMECRLARALILRKYCAEYKDD